MAPKKKAKKKAKKPAARKARAQKTRSKNPRPKKISAKRPAKKAKKKAAPKRTAPKKAVRAVKAIKTNRRPAPQRRTQPISRPAEPRTMRTDSDSQGLSTRAEAGPESVSELIDEGNVFEAGVVAGVERADDSEGKEVQTREFPEDDVPEEYIDQD